VRDKLRDGVAVRDDEHVARQVRGDAVKRVVKPPPRGGRVLRPGRRRRLTAAGRASVRWEDM